ncbi:iron complex outermembrane recepter protein [Chryseobacterium piscicola]|uniref:Iron complex outermembrane recepter protein n=1 Tax=Chryseobacterium piscicola TaxID=551459 RepID=A0A1N7MA53_9FLAO|nr:TonB-dependent receptor [Chryseobacterium piscicola]PQA98166.1 TonB-dependent siderophore receptor [Chryseobacterium piscicola]SIS82859.1 iron complex outermembrane recepter protein [Chryseobacterium piscicola]
MKRQIITIGFIVISATVSAQLRNTENDTLRITTIEDVNLHKTGNPNKATSVSTKSKLTMMETPQPIAIVTHEIIEQQQSRQLSDVLQNVNGMYVTSSRGNSQDSFGGRGFILGNDNMFKNGSRINSGVFPEVSGLERVEVLKGANAMLYGNTAAGGVINMITKKPKFNFGGNIGLNAGSWNSYKPTVDIYGPLSKKIAFRVNGTYEYAESFRDVVQSEKYYFNPSFVFNLNPKSQLIVEADYLKNNFTPDFGIGSIENKDKSFSLKTGLDRNIFLGTDWQYQDVEQVSTNATFNHQFNDNWSLNSTVSYQNYTKDYFSTERVLWSYATANPNRLSWNRPLNRTYNEQNYTSAQVNLNGEFNTGSINHKVLVGTDADYGVSDSYTYYNPTNNKNYGSTYFYGTDGGSGLLFLDNSSTWAGGAMPESQRLDKTRVNTRRIGVYAQDFISLTKEFKVIAGLRWSYIENMPTLNTKFKTNLKSEVNNSATSDQAVSPKVGLVYNPNDNLSVFATYTNSFVANTGLDAFTLNSLKPSLVDQYEVGAKKNLWNNAVAVNLSLYQISYRDFYQAFIDPTTNLASTDPRNLKEFVGKMRSRGVELDITGNPSKNLSIIGGVSYNNSIYLDTPEKVGYVENQRLVRTPATTANLSLFYTFTKGIKGLKVGASAYYIGDRLAGWNDTKFGSSTSLASRNGVSRVFELKDYTTFSLSAGYEWKKFMIQAKVGNLFDVENYNVHENYSVNPITPRNYYFTLTYKL